MCKHVENGTKVFEKKLKPNGTEVGELGRQCDPLKMRKWTITFYIVIRNQSSRRLRNKTVVMMFVAPKPKDN